MIDLIEVLQSQRVPIDSFIAAAAHCNQSEFNKDKYDSFISALLDKPIESPNVLTARLIWGYMCQHIIWHTKHNVDMDINVIFASAQLDANKLLHGPNYKWMWVQPEGTLRDDGTIVEHKKKGWKQIKAAEIFAANPNSTKKEIIALFVKEMDMTPSGAQTYYYNLKREQGETK